MPGMRALTWPNAFARAALSMMRLASATSRRRASNAGTDPVTTKRSYYASAQPGVRPKNERKNDHQPGRGLDDVTAVEYVLLDVDHVDSAARFEQLELAVLGGGGVGFAAVNVVDPRPQAVWMIVYVVVAAVTQHVGPGRAAEPKRPRLASRGRDQPPRDELVTVPSSKKALGSREIYRLDCAREARTSDDPPHRAAIRAKPNTRHLIILMARAMLIDWSGLA